MKNLFIVLLLFIYNSYHAQNKDDIKHLEDLTHSIAKGVNTKNHEAISNAFVHPSALIYSTFSGLSNGSYSKELNTAQGLSDFVKNFNKPLEQIFDFVNVNLLSNGRATVSTYYYVKIDGKKSHQGHEFYSAIKTSNGWKFVSLIFTTEPWN
ncbi:hypothetical protein [uncultured Psychroserpens sp.]|uniref:hypothetical protein n=1 Tax=uncultured Psychroserpens sp. TaxID=255436 RepID=UPI002619754A|nr:hypothetical protein [uncultured Psychroserpens sp.]